MDQLASGLIVRTPLPIMSVYGGDVFHALKNTDVEFKGFGEAYFSQINPSAIKGWKMHTRMTMNLIVPLGRVRFVFFSDADDFIGQFISGFNEYSRITVKPGIWFAFQNIYSEPALVLNIANILHDPAEVRKRNLSEISFDWKL